MDLAISSATTTYKLPLSCCNTPDSRQICDDGSRIGLSAKIPVVMYKDVRTNSVITTLWFLFLNVYNNINLLFQGCIDKLKEVMSDHMIIAWALMITIAILEIFGLIFSLVLCCAVRSVDRYKS